MQMSYEKYQVLLKFFVIFDFAVTSDLAVIFANSLDSLRIRIKVSSYRGD